MSTDPNGGPAGEPDDGGRHADHQAANDAWSAFGLMLSGVIIWGGAGYLVSRWTGYEVFTMLGLLLGTGTALYGIWFRYGRS
jgi:hypothetical protein